MAAPVETVEWTLICRVCGEDLKFGRKPGQVFNLFLNLGLKALLEAITEVPVVMGDGVSVYAHSICLHCKQLLEKYDRARVNLENIAHLVRELCDKNTAGRKRCKIVYVKRENQSYPDGKRIRTTSIEASSSADMPPIPERCGTVHIKSENPSPPASPDRKRRSIEAALSAVMPPIPEPVLPLVSQPASQKQTGKLIAAVPFSLGSVKSAVQRLSMDRQEPRKSTPPIPTASVLPLTVHNMVKPIPTASVLPLTVHNMVKPIPTRAAVPQSIQSTSTQNTSPKIRPSVLRPSSMQRRQRYIDRKIIKVQRTTQNSSASRILRGPLEKMGELLLRGKHERLPKVMMAVPGMLDATVDKVLELLKKECKTLCSPLFNSILRRTNPQALTDFKWDTLIAEWRANAPIFLKFLECAGTVYNETLRLQGLKSRQKHQRKTQACTMAMAGATLLRSRDIAMSAPMYRNTFLLRHGGVKKMCIQQLTRIGVCMSYRQSMSKLKEMHGRKEWDTKLLQWKDDSGCQTTDEQCPVEEGLTDESSGQKADSDASSSSSQSGLSEMVTTDTESGEESPYQSEQDVSSPSCEESAMSDFQPLSESELTALYVEQERSSGFLATND